MYREGQEGFVEGLCEYCRDPDDQDRVRCERCPYEGEGHRRPLKGSSLR